MTVQSKSCKDNELNISVSILKLSNKNIDSFTYFGTNTAASVDPSKQNKSINDEVNFRNEQQQCVRSFTMIKNNQKTNLNYSFQQYATTISTPVSMLKDESTYTYNVSLKTTLSTRCTNSKIYKSPLRSIITSDTIPATILILMIHTAAIPLIKMPSLLLIALESESANLWKHKSALNMTLNDNITAGIDHQSLKKSTFIKYIQCCWFRLEAIPEEDQSRISNDLTNLLYPNKDVEHTIVTSPTDQNLENKFVSDIHEKFTSKVKIKEHRKLNDNLVIDDLNSINVLTSNLLMDQTFEILPTIDGIDEHKSILNSKSNLSSSHTVDQLTSERKDQSNNDRFSSLSTEQLHMLKLNESFIIGQDMIHSTNSTEYIPSVSTTNSFSSIDETKFILSNEGNLEKTLDESSIKNTMSVDSDDISEQSINLVTINLHLFDKESKSTLEKNQIHENDDNVQVINLDQHETTLLKHSISLQSKASVSKTHTLAFLCQRNTLQGIS
ncbi:unnamed protein product [Rotaria magnacalcarata]|uniref:Uncharacterized protein n=1 Tax=Rotaria magnacalcarata TaxID=392030 RepID=A0A8S2Q875_9BILA|nr:unnamed protein product [Rotaria magnacalcarata]